MKRLLVVSAVVVALAGGGYAYQAAAESGPAGVDAGPGPGQPPGPGPGPGPGPDGWAEGPGPGFPGPGFPGPGFPGPGGWPPDGPGGGDHHHDDAFGLFARVDDKNLDSADVKTIATAILLEHGNHDWTVSNVTAEPDKSIQFSYATLHGDVIAVFSVDPISGRIKRLR
jgi:hypothetical protein